MLFIVQMAVTTAKTVAKILAMYTDYALSSPELDRFITSSYVGL